MSDTALSIRIEELSGQIALMKSEIEQLNNRSMDEDLWDNSDLIRKWKISQRTLASWRSKGLIDYVQMGGKIWYTKENRNSFLSKNKVKAKGSVLMVCSN
jgi:phage pi2 protein 07